MRRCHRLSQLATVARRRLHKLRSTAERAAAFDRAARETQVAFVTVEALNTWANFVRSYYLSCVGGAKHPIHGRISIVAGPMSMHQAIGYAVRRWKKAATPKSDGSWDRRDEPTWHDPYVLRQVLLGVGASNTADVDAALSIGTRVFVDLPVARNFYAHRNENTDHAVRRLAPLYGIPATLRPSQIMFERALGRPQFLLLDWLDDLDVVCDLLCR